MKLEINCFSVERNLGIHKYMEIKQYTPKQPIDQTRNQKKT